MTSWDDHEISEHDRPSFLDLDLTLDVSESADDVDDQARAYLLTGGRTGNGRVAVAFESMVAVTREAAECPPPGLTPECQIIVAAAAQPISVAEIAAHTGLPIGVVQVLVGDLIYAGTLDSGDTLPATDDIHFIERLIRGVNAL